MDLRLTLGLITILIPAILMCIFNDKFKKRKHEKFINNLMAGKRPEISLEKPENGVIKIDENGFNIKIQRKKIITEKSINWNRIEEIRAYKRDLFTFDLICWGFRLTADEHLLEVNEEMLGFSKLVKKIESHFNINPTDWRPKVAFPAFDLNMTVIWRKENRSRQAI